MNRIFLLLIVLLLLNYTSNSQQESEKYFQTVKGVIVDLKTQQPVIGARVFIEGMAKYFFSKQDGSFVITNVPVGRHVFKVYFIGYETYYQNIILSSGKELQLDVQLEESFVSTEVVQVIGNKEINGSVNEVGLVSNTLFSVDDVSRFAGGRMDPAKMAQNFAGVLGASDMRNDIIIRGGSPTELLWRIDGVDVPNPNHFATQGSTGGPVCAINSLLLDNSDFFTGAFPAEYGGKMSGVFDLHTRKGNKDKYEYLGNFGFNGLELGMEGPTKLWNGSFIANYRYSFLDLLEKMGVNFGFAGIPRYQDGMFKIDLNPDEKHQISFTGLFGKSNISILQSKLDTVYTGDFDVNNGSDFYSLGINWQQLYSDKLYGKLILGRVWENYHTELDSITTLPQTNSVTSIDKWLNDNSIEGYNLLKYNIYFSPNTEHFITAGIEGRDVFYNLLMKRYTTGWNDSQPLNINQTGNSFHFLSFINWNWRPFDCLTTNIGFNYQYLDISKKSSFEPRLSLSLKIFPQHSLNFGFGVYNAPDGNVQKDV